MDGGTIWDVNIDSAVNQCLNMGYPEDKIIMDVLVCGYTPELEQQVYGSDMKNFQDARNIKKYYNDINSIVGEIAAFPNAQMRYYFQEHNTGCSGSELDFNNSTTWCLQEAGRRDAQNMLNIGQSNIRATLDDWVADKQIRKDFPYIGDYLKSLFNF